jgi:hypothetical protein
LGEARGRGAVGGNEVEIAAPDVGDAGAIGGDGEVGEGRGHAVGLQPLVVFVGQGVELVAGEFEIGEAEAAFGRGVPGVEIEMAAALLIPQKDKRQAFFGPGETVGRGAETKGRVRFFERPIGGGERDRGGEA